LFTLCILLPGCIGPPLVISPRELPNAVEGVLYFQSLSTDDGLLWWELEDGTLPPGLQLDEDTGAIAGRPTEPGVYDFTVLAEDARIPPRRGERLYSITVIERLTVQFSPDPARVGEPYEDTPMIAGGVPPYRVVIVGLPAGLDYDRSTGKIFGTPRTANSGMLLELSATDDGDPRQTKTVRATLVVHPVGVSITTSELADAAVGEEYSAQLAASGGKRPYTWKVSGGALPDGLRLNRTIGEISGTPTVQAVTKTFTITVTDSDSPLSTDSRELKLVVPVTVLTDTLTPATGKSYESALGAIAGMRPYTWSVTDGVLPKGLQLSSAGVISGELADDSLTETFTVTVTDSDSPPTADSHELKLVVPVVLATSELPDATIGQPYKVTLAASRGLPPYTWSLKTGRLPDGLELAEDTGVISGTPAAQAQTQTFTIQVADGDDPATTADQQLTIEVGS
jgi:hypothetical protein